MLLTLTKLLPVEGILKYTFNNKSLLAQALTHASFRSTPLECYERLEFLGDAILDLIVMDFLYQFEKTQYLTDIPSKYPNLAPSDLTTLKSRAVNNSALACIAFFLNLHKYMRHLLPFFAELLQQPRHDVNGSVTYPRVLADVFESLAGAVFVDSGFSYEVVHDVFWPLLRDFICTSVTPSAIDTDPVKCEIILNLFNNCSDLILEIQRNLRQSSCPSPFSFSLENGQHLCSVVLFDEPFSFASSSSKESAKKTAAKLALEKIKAIGFPNIPKEYSV